jgi:hypothetical protein
VAAACIYVAKGIEIWIRRQEHPAIEVDLTSVGISGRAGRVTASSAAVVVDTTVLEASARARRGTICRLGRKRRERQGGSSVSDRKARIKAMSMWPARTVMSPIDVFVGFIYLVFSGVFSAAQDQ